VEYNSNRSLDTTTVEDSCNNTCLGTCTCTGCVVQCPAPATSTYCVRGVCDAECDTDDHCADSECDDQDGCYDGTYRDYKDMSNTCTDTCDCTTNGCTEFSEAVTDEDGDGFDTECDADCDDADALVYADAPEFYDGKDNDCDGEVDEDGISVIDDTIQSLPDDAFTNNPDQRKNALSNQLAAVMGAIEAGDYDAAINQLTKDIRAKADGSLGGNPNNDWIVDEDAQQLICGWIDDLVEYLGTLA
jgi:hypothetical protein